MANKVSIATKPLVYQTFRYIDNKVWNALAEYVDNSYQSYENHKDVLSEINPNGNVRVSIDVNFEKNTIVIEDNAYGIEEANYQRAFELANIPLDATGLNEFGMGMKVSSIWLSNTWEVETSAYGENVRKFMRFDLNEVLANQETELPITEESAGIEEHYTKITLSNLSVHKPTSRQMSAIKNHLTSIYTLLLRDKKLDLTVNGETLICRDLKILNAPYYKRPDSEPIEWIKKIDKKAPNPNGGNYVVKGFIALLETMSTSKDNGILLFRRGRVIGTSYDDKYRPELLSGQIGSPRYKRIFGELYLEGFNVSFTKNTFQEDDNFTTLIEMIHEEMAKDKSLDLFGQAQNYVKPKTKKEKQEVGQKIVKQIAEELTKTIDLGKQYDDEVKDSVSEKVKEATQSVVDKSSLFPDLPEEPDGITSFEAQIKFGSKTIYLTIKCENGSSKKNLYDLTHVGDNYVSVINMSNPFFEQHADVLSKSDGRNLIAYIIKLMVASEIVLQEQGQNDGTHFRNEFNNLCGRL